MTEEKEPDKKVSGGPGITAGGNVSITGGSGQVAIGKTIIQVLILSDSDKQEFLKILKRFEKEEATENDRERYMQILKTGTKTYFTDIIHATTEKKQNAIAVLNSKIKKPLLTTTKMPEEVYNLYIEDCIDAGELLDWDQWLINRLKNMSPLPNRLQQSIFNYGLTRLADMNVKSSSHQVL